ncbi:dTDP-L-rhamnose 4-epimerase [Algoriphagus ratkowskyi]|uniref:NAD-dependent epimerase/dehydratase family protein n=1 Tax=Algoriphagus ratkowskyi TaxID=57028 RepID=A0A2W7QMI6_9BACT|nr:NAD-dependent epimerase/dehydratase family protein [Algoriphagus ratkowskyi]PZX49678.1 dTDP-L-rhamnose 4-epimerase [Algoriphagus ratkowskyi]TXD75449.1 NAD-dependent epimerase/dehydratase family protein [Algoriphagus ratkowskyi]
MKNILITGGAGFIGSTLGLKLTKQGYHVTVLDNLSKQIHGANPEKDSSTYQSILNSGIKFIKGTVTSKSDWVEAIKDQDAIVHLAAETGTGQSMYEIQKYVDVNISGTSLMLDLLTNSNHTVKKIVVASSRAIYGEGKYLCNEHKFVYPVTRNDEDMIKGDFECKCPICNSKLELVPTDENSKIHPTSIYGITKQVQEQMVLTMGKSLGIPAVAFRYQNVYGPGQSLSNPYTGILSIFSTQIKNNNNLNIFEDGKESRDFVYIEDVVNATLLGLLKKEADYEVFNVGADKPIDVLTVARLLKENYNSDIKINITGNYRKGDIRHNYGDLEKIKNILGFTPQFSFSEGIKIFCNWVENQEVQEDNYQNSINEMKNKGLYK